ncbi:glyoxalase-like domain-containing protein [Desarmillaria tabescens]|uniref:Glyoxalase-like domain-containing protein n=1 Tax=Armillaria tabescens TaxID=1929756 RepID=A0AA39N2M7_ARMTA|nr:glyoxalase-like domain-containing protein [Desarmillaria tabescens]KAK0455223.1 glyoxalase-like domain-containing protein [Desarmillaria tabescens]
MKDTSTRILDHIVHLTPPGTVQQASDSFKSLGFKVLEGGTHADGLTSNALVVLADGVYLELIAFTHAASWYPLGSDERHRRESHRWAMKQPGWIDFAFLGNGSKTTRMSDIINARGKLEGSGTVYQSEVEGGRIRPDGVELKWLITSPAEEGVLPFFCGDLTPRELRVPLQPPSNTVHLCTASGIAHVRVLAENRSIQHLSQQFTSVIGERPVQSSSQSFKWSLQTSATASSKRACELILSVPVSEGEHAFIGDKEHGIYEIGFWVKEKQQPGSVVTPYGRITWVNAD